MKVFKKAGERTEKDRSRLRKTVGEIIERVIKEGDDALREYNRSCDGCERESLRIGADEIRRAYEKVSSSDIDDIKKAAAI